MKVLTVVNDLDKGGTQRGAQNFALGYKDLGHDSRILTVNGLGSRYHEIADKLVIYDGLIELRSKLKNGWLPDIVHIHSHVTNPESIFMVISYFKSEKTKIIETNVFSTPSPWADLIDVSFQLSKWAMWLFLLRGGANFKSVILGNPINFENFKPKSSDDVNRFKLNHGLPVDSFIMGRIGEHFSSKWSPLLIDAFEFFARKYPHLYLVVVNTSVDTLAKIDVSNYRDRIVVIDRIDGDVNLAIAYSSFDITVHIANIGESFGYIIPESAFCGTPVISMATPWEDNSQCEIVTALGGVVVHKYKTLLFVLEEVIQGRWKFPKSQLLQERFKRNYDYIYLASEAVLYAKQEKSIEIEKINTFDILRLLDLCYDKPNFLVKLCLLMKIDFMRKKTIYLTGYYSIKYIHTKLLKKIKKHFQNLSNEGSLF